ncbi:PREDICTED: putative uncharacterized protein MYH16, partial [Thamnophis sirtalis]|uniref:Myosin tail domain-containing protein n=1 Tax=Thamnophis sirtalis TaxID=35019 RepID=A0A6I9XXT2_9SAUR
MRVPMEGTSRDFLLPHPTLVLGLSLLVWRTWIINMKNCKTPPNFKKLIASTISHSIASSMKQQHSKDPVLKKAQPPSTLQGAGKKASDPVLPPEERDAPGSPSLASGGSVSGEEPMRGLVMSDEEDTGKQDIPSFAGLFQPSLFKQLLTKTKLGGSDSTPTPESQKDPTKTMFVKKPLDKEEVPVPPLFLEVVTTSRHLLWLKNWQVDNKLKFHLTSTPYTRGNLFGEALEPILVENKEKKKVLPLTTKCQENRPAPYRKGSFCTSESEFQQNKFIPYDLEELGRRSRGMAATISQIMGQSGLTIAHWHLLLSIRIDIQLEDNWEQEKKIRAEVEKARRKAEGDLKMTIENLNEMERTKLDLEEVVKPLLNVARQEEEMKAKEEELRNAMSKTQELVDRIKELEEKLATLSQEKNDLTIQLQAEQENLTDAEERLTQMMKAKMDLESQISDMKERLEEEESSAASLSAHKRKLEAELNDLKRDLEGLETTLAKTEKEKQARIEELEEELEAERSIRAKIEKQRSDLSRELEELTDRLEEAGGATTAQIEQNRKREAELLKLRRELEEAALQSEATASTLRKKHTDAMAEMTEHLENLQRVKSKLEKDKQVMKAEIDDLSSSMENVQKSKINAEAHVRRLEDNLAEVNARLAEMERNQAETNAVRNRLQGRLSSSPSQSNAACAALDKKQRAFDKMMAEWQQKCEELQLEVDNSQKECRMYMTENFKLKTAYEEALEQLESVKKENKTLQ